MKKNVEERLLGMMAVEKRLITEKQLTECLNIQEFFDPRPLMELMLEKGYLTEQQVHKLQSILNQQTKTDQAGGRKKKTAPQKLFGELAIESYMITRDQLEECLQEQKELLKRNAKQPIGQVLISKGYMTPTQVTRILEMQSKKILYCKVCKTSYTVLNYREDQFYHCKKCGLDLVESEVIPVQKRPGTKTTKKRADKAESKKRPGDEDLPELKVLEL